MNVFVRCEICRRKCKYRGSVSKTTCDRVDGCIVAESEINNYTKVGLECSRKRGLKKS